MSDQEASIFNVHELLMDDCNDYVNTYLASYERFGRKYLVPIILLTSIIGIIVIAISLSYSDYIFAATCGLYLFVDWMVIYVFTSRTYKKIDKLKDEWKRDHRDRKFDEFMAWHNAVKDDDSMENQL